MNIQSKIYYEIVTENDEQFHWAIKEITTKTYSNKDEAYNILFNLYKDKYNKVNDFKYHNSIMRKYGIRKWIKLDDEIFKTDIKHYTIEELQEQFNWNDKYIQSYKEYKEKEYKAKNVV